MSKATNAPDTDKASTFRLGNGVPLQGFGLLVDGPRNQGVANCDRMEGENCITLLLLAPSFNVHALVSLARHDKNYCIYVIFLRFHVFCIFQTLYMFLTAHSHHSSPATTFQAVFTGVP